jgi:hypothetical protein
MIDIEKVKNDYEKYKSQSVSSLLPFKKILQLENYKEEISEKYLKKIIKISSDFEIQTTSGFNIDSLIKIAKSMFGDLNFYDTNMENGKISIDMAFHFCIISLIYFEKMKYKITIFWDM